MLSEYNISTSNCHIQSKFAEKKLKITSNKFSNEVLDKILKNFPQTFQICICNVFSQFLILSNILRRVEFKENKEKYAICINSLNFSMVSSFVQNLLHTYNLSLLMLGLPRFC